MSREIFSAILVAVTVAILAWVYIAESQCSEKGGVRLRALIGMPTCYAKDSLKELE